MKEIILVDPEVNGAKSPKVFDELKKHYDEIKTLQTEGKPVYIKILEGDRKGSIGKFICDDIVSVKIYDNGDYWRDGNRWRFTANNIMGNLIWDGRKNKIQFFLYPSGTFAWLKDYDGPTIYKIFNKKAAKDKALKNPNQVDIENNILKINDEVIYVNIRYGSGARLTKGKIIRFDAKIFRNRKDNPETIYYTIVKEHRTGEESKIEHSDELILKSK